MRKINYLITIIIFFFLLILPINAEEVNKTAFANCVNDNSYLNIRSTPSVAGELAAAFACNTSFIVIDDNAGDANGYTWYKIRYGNNLEGYVVSNYVAFDYIESEENLIIDNNKGYVSCTENDDPLNVRSSIIANDSIVSLSCDTEMSIISKDVGSNDRCSNWYQISSGGYTGYVCGTYVYQKTIVNMNEDNIENYKSYLRSIGFSDETYLNYLVNLHAEHPTWQFRAIRTRTNWDYVISNENVQGRNLVYYTYGEGYRSKDNYSYNYETDTYSRHPTETNWWYASISAIKYYMDPRNFLNTNDIFMFESLYYQPVYQTSDLVRTMLDGTFLSNIYASVYGKENRYTYATDFIEASSTYNVSPVHLASRILQEGNGTTSISYNNNTYTVYNFFNINATGENPGYQGLVWASGLSDNGTTYGRPWDTPKKSILGGAQFLAYDYISVGQNNLYLQKFAVYSSSASVSLYSHQYMQNLTAPLTEGRKSYNSYYTLDKMDSSFVFIIPVYDNMPISTSIPVADNPNSYLKSITIDNIEISNFTYNNTSYSITVPSLTTSVSLGASSINGNASINGTGMVNLISSLTIVPIKVTAQNGNVTTYNITINREKSTINTLDSISIDKINFIFDKDTLIYNLYTNYNVSIININYQKTDSLSTVTGPTSKDLVVGSNRLEYVVTSESGEVKTYIINIIRYDENGENNLSSVNTLKSLTIDEKNIEFSKDILNYDLIVDYEITNLTITYIKEDEKSLVDISNTSLIVGNNTINVIVTAENGEIKIYVLNVKRNDMSSETILSNSSVKYNSSYISGINLGTNVDTLINKVKSVNNNALISITDKNNNIITNTSLKTGYNVIITTNGIESKYKIVILGDIDGDGEISKSDMLAIQKHIFGYGSVSGAYYEASDIDIDDKITKSDLLAMQKHIFGYGNIKQ